MNPCWDFYNLIEGNIIKQNYISETACTIACRLLSIKIPMI